MHTQIYTLNLNSQTKYTRLHILCLCVSNINVTPICIWPFVHVFSIYSSRFEFFRARLLHALFPVYEPLMQQWTCSVQASILCYCGIDWPHLQMYYKTTHRTSTKFSQSSRVERVLRSGDHHSSRVSTAVIPHHHIEHCLDALASSVDQVHIVVVTRNTVPLMNKLRCVLPDQVYTPRL